MLAEGRYYTLAEAWSLLVQSLAAYADGGSLPETVTLRVPRGPLEDATGLAQSFSIEAQDLLELARSLSSTLGPADWTETPRDIIPAQVSAGGKTLNAAEFLLAAARVLAELAGAPLPETIQAEPCEMFPGTLDLLNAASMPRFPGVSWSLKPARHR
ncbi:MAG: hypothetical protein HY906_21260 [Deltaproteobacteria bacterium]|nr:hypothetical protein [Deltaproteobacteria bacterium]